MNTYTFCSFLFPLKPLAGRILEGLENNRSTACIFNQLAQFLLQSALHFTIWHSILVIGINFFKNIFLFLGRVPR